MALDAQWGEQRSESVDLCRWFPSSVHVTEHSTEVSLGGKSRRCAWRDIVSSKTVDAFPHRVLSFKRPLSQGRVGGCRKPMLRQGLCLIRGPKHQLVTNQK